MAVNKVVQSNGTTLIDITPTTAVPSDVASGKIFYLASGAQSVGTNEGTVSDDPFTQWQGKTWYAYGTSITNTAAEGKYPTYLAQMSGMTLVNKGISGGGIGNLGAYSTGQVYNAICNTTDGKLNADLITLETGENDVDDANGIVTNLPLGTVYDTGRSTLAGCLNDCLQYLQANTNAQIVVIPSPIESVYQPITANSLVYEWYRMMEQICNINRVHFINSNNNMGWAKLASTKGSTYIVDNVHQTELGGYVFAQNIWYQLRNIPTLASSVSPTPTPSDEYETMFDGSLTVEELTEWGMTFKVSYIDPYSDGQLTNGDEYRITYNGTEYNLTVDYIPGETVLCLGNPRWYGADTSAGNEPFCITNEGGTTVGVFTNETTGSTITLKLERKISE